MTDVNHHWRETAFCQESIVAKDKNDKCQNPNIKWFDKLTTLSQVEGQIPTRGASACAARDSNSKYQTVLNDLLI